MKKVYSVEEYIEINSHFNKALIILRTIINTTELNESIKWSAPVYHLNGKNVLSLGAFKKHFCIWFFNGVFLKDDYKLLVTAQKTTKALRQMRFESIEDINKDIVLDYIKEAIENQKLGKEIKPVHKAKKQIIIPEILKTEFINDSTFNATFKLLTPGRQREYYDYISEAKRDTTKISRLKKIKPMILNGKGLNDKYRS